MPGSNKKRPFHNGRSFLGGWIVFAYVVNLNQSFTLGLYLIRLYLLFEWHWWLPVLESHRF